MTHIESLFEIQKLADEFMRLPTADTSETDMARLVDWGSVNAAG